MRFTTRARYALRMMLDIASHGGGRQPVSLAKVSARTGLSHGYLEQLAVGLRAGRLLRGISGRQGGYKLVGTAEQITIASIIEAVIGPICVVECLETPEDCVRADYCECRIVYDLINKRITDVLEEFTLADLLDPSWVRSHTGGALAVVPAGVRPVPGEPLEHCEK